MRSDEMAEAQCLPRLLDQFAQRGLIPSIVIANQAGTSFDIVIEHPTMEDADAALMSARMTRMPMVESACSSRLRDG